MDLNDLRIKTDYENSFEGKGKLELGYQYRRLMETNDQSMTYFDIPGGSWVEDTTSATR